MLWRYRKLQLNYSYHQYCEVKSYKDSENNQHLNYQTHICLNLLPSFSHPVSLNIESKFV